MGVTIKGGSGDPLKVVIRLKKAATPTVGDALYGGQRQRSRVLLRTGKGVDADGAKFAPYSTKGPYYYNPNGRLSPITAGQVSEKQQKAAAKRFYNKIVAKEERGRDGSPHMSKTGRSVVFSSYRAFKAWLGRANVDLRGPRAPHMLQGVVVKAGGQQVERDISVGIDDSGQPASEMRVGIYGDAADRASGHNAGAGKLPRRHFFGIGRGDAKALVADVLSRMRVRMNRKG